VADKFQKKEIVSVSDTIIKAL